MACVLTKSFDLFQAREMHIKKQYRNALKTQTLQYKALQKQILEKAPKERHKELTKQLREEKMRKMADLSVQYDQSISEMLQRQTVREEFLVLLVRFLPCFLSVHSAITLFRAVFTWVSKVIRICFGFALLRSVIGLKKLAPLSQPIRSKTKTTFSRASCRLHVFASSFDWFTGLSLSFVIGQGDNFGFCFENCSIP